MKYILLAFLLIGCRERTWNRATFKIPNSYHFGYDSIEVFDFKNGEPLLVNFFHFRTDTIIIRHDASVTFSDSSVAYKIDSMTSIVRYFSSDKTKTYPSEIWMRNSYISDDSMNLRINDRHVIISKLEP